MKKIALILFAGALLNAIPAFAGPGDLDTSFGVNGGVTIDLGGDEDVGDMVLDASGNILVTGSQSGNIFLARILRNGTLDTTFGADYNADGILDGYTIVDHGGVEGATDVNVDAAGNIYVLGQTIGHPLVGDSLIVTRFLPDGTYDPSWGGGVYGFAVLFLNAQPGARKFAAAFDSLGNYFFASDYSGGIAYGLTDPAGVILGFVGVHFPSAGSGAVDYLKAVAIQNSDDKQLFLGTTGVDSFITRKNAQTGLLDASYGTSGVVGTSILTHLVTSNPGAILAFRDVILDPDPSSPHYDKAVVVGDIAGEMIVVRFDLSGNLDTTFNTTGYRTINFGASAFLHEAVTMGSGGRIVIAGDVSPYVGLTRIKKNGRKDRPFGTSGETLTYWTGTEHVTNVFITARGRILVGGYNGLLWANDIFLLRYHN